MRFSLRLAPLVLLAGCLMDGGGSIPPGVDTRLTLLHTSDIHSRLFPFEIAPNAGDTSLGLDEGNAPFGGAARLAYLIKRERARSERVLHLDSGDCFQGAPVFNQSYGEPELRFLSEVGLDAAVIGNHEFDAGVTNLQDQLMAWAGFDVLAANYIYPNPDDPNFHDLARLSAPYAIYNVGGLKVGVIGMANLGSLTSIGEGGNSLQITPAEQNDTVRAYVNLLHGSVDLVVVLTHLGLEEDEYLLRGYEVVTWKDRLPDGWTVKEDLGNGRVLAWVPGVRGIDVVMGGHLHVVLNPPKVVTDLDGRQVIIAHSGAFSKFLGRLDLVVKDDLEMGGKRVVSHKYQVFPVDQRLANYEDAAVSEMLEPYLVELNDRFDLKRVMGYAPKDITRRSQTGNGDSGLGNLVAESMRSRRRVAAEIAVTNTLGIRDNFYRGPITLEDRFNVFPFENTLTVMYLSGDEVQELANFITERSAGRGCQSQAQISGWQFTMNCGRVLANENATSYEDPGEDILIQSGEDLLPLDPAATYKVATNDYIANGGSGFRVLKRNTTKFDTGVSLRDALADYLGTLSACGDYEVKTGHHCFRADEFSQSVCAEIVDCQRYVDDLIEQLEDEGANCTPGQVSRLPSVCHAAVDAFDPCTVDQAVKGPYADTPCVVGIEDGRLKRKTSEGLDSLEDGETDESQE